MSDLVVVGHELESTASVTAEEWLEPSITGFISPSRDLRVLVRSPPRNSLVMAGPSEVAKVNHHGSSYSSNWTYVSTLDAETAIISVGNNSYGHPSSTVINRWDSRGRVYQTQRGSDGALIDGSVMVTTGGLDGFRADTEAGGARTFPMDES